MELLTAVLLLAIVGLSSQAINYCNSQLCPKGISHVACNGLSTLAPSCGAGSEEIIMDEAKINLIVSLHNELRNKVATGKQTYARDKLYPQASRMATLQWSPELAAIAGANTRRCVYGHDQCRNTEQFKHAGQNIAQISLQGKSVPDVVLIKQLINNWFSEYSNANPDIIARYTNNISGPVGHFTQMVSDRTTRIGCAMVSYNQQPWEAIPLVIGIFAACIVMVNVTYIKADAKQIPGLEFFIGKSRLVVLEKFQKKKIDKFVKKYMVL
ncbi:antigen 5 like allergen Cul n 1-like [Sabethes cyaneus]|uniref:antigen 5 like allergen Cul n 1-like n=1 Tax=Sabethes cyaneus TaxID=53552 RepID=UPI00237E8ACE|nr:antigen 5 like allergen Cul n 1-like [Sabethes cyaneus]